MPTQHMRERDPTRGAGAEPLRLPYAGPARLEHQGETVKLRRKSLAILYYLAIEGPTRRQFLADLLWEGRGTSQNLRVELHGIKKTLAALGVHAFEEHQDPLRFPHAVRLDTSEGGGDPLEGLEDLAPGFQRWLEAQRARGDTHRAGGFARRDLVLEVASRIRPPYLLVLSGQPDSGQRIFAEMLANALDLEMREDAEGTGSALRYLSGEREVPPERILADPRSVWVLERLAFGEDSEFLLTLRSRFAPERTSYLELPPLSWQEVRPQLPSTLPFARAAQLYTTAGGHPGYLRELLALDRSGDPAATPRVPQRVRAAYALASRRLTSEARFALERASVHPGPLGTGLLDALGVEEHRVELERQGWLVFDDGWRFVDDVARAVLYRALPPGQARLHHQQAARRLANDGEAIAAAYHRAASDGRVDWQALTGHGEAWARHLAAERAGGAVAELPPRVRATLLEERPLSESEVLGAGTTSEQGRVTLVRQPLQSGVSGVEWQLPPGPGVLRLSGGAYLRNALDVGLRGDAVPLRIDLLGPDPASVVLAAVREPHLLDDGTMLLPWAEEIDLHLRWDDARFVRISSRADHAVVELTATLHATGTSTSAPAVPAWDCGAAAGSAAASGDGQSLLE